ncbi:MAG: DUF1573 domain-containing protein [Paludibacteraceae bacterium]|nr:DUF1573 domain-containing protein [Paludibacteraceae bacterium]
MKRVAYIIFLLSLASTAIAQQSKCSVDNENFNVGILLQEDTATEHTFVLCNESTDTMYINRVEPTCNFIIKEWPKNGIAPDMTGNITVELNTSNIFGDFKQHFYVYGTMPTMKLFISGFRGATATNDDENYTAKPLKSKDKKTKKKKKRK